MISHSIHVERIDILPGPAESESNQQRFALQANALPIELSGDALLLYIISVVPMILIIDNKMNQTKRVERIART